MAINTHSIDFELSSSQYSSVADTASLSITGDITIEVWIKLEQLPSTAGDTFTINAKDDDNTNRSWWFNVGSDDKLVFIYSSDGNTTDQTVLNTDAVIVDSGDVGEWVHLAVAVDVSAKSMVVYKDTSLQASSLQSGTDTSIHNNSSRFGVAVDRAGGTPRLYFDGKMNNMRIWNDIRSSGEISANWKEVLTNTGTANLVDAWYYNSNHNSASGNNNLTASGSPVFSSDIPFGGKTGSLYYSQI